MQNRIILKYRINNLKTCVENIPLLLLCECIVSLQCLTQQKISHRMVIFNVLRQGKQWKTRISLFTHQI